MTYLFDRYRLDEEDFCLTRDGERISVEPKALRVLLAMVVNAGRLLEKKVLLAAVWKDTFVEETTLTRAIAVLRKSLGDDSRSPRFIETIPTLGYRFIAQVETMDSSKQDTQPDAGVSEGFKFVDPEALLSEIKTDGIDQTSAVNLAGQGIRSQRGRTLYLGGVAVIVIFVAIVAGFRISHRERRPLGVQGTILLADFTNTSGDALFDDILRQGMAVQLEQSPVLHLVSEGAIRKTLRLMGKSPDSVISSDLGREVCQRLGGAAILDGALSRVGTEYVLGLKAKSCATGELLDGEQVQVERKEDVLAALSGISTKFRTRVGESLSTISTLDTPLAEATTSSLEALKAYSQAIRLFNTTGSAQALPLFKRATELDPDFAMAHAWLGRMYADFEEESLSVASTGKAYQLRERASDRERFSIDVSYDLIVSGNLTKARETCEAWTHMYPSDSFPHAFLSGIIYPAFGQYDKALVEARKTIEVDPDFVVGYRNLATNSIALNRLQDAEDALHQAAARKLSLGSFVTARYRIAFLRGNAKEMKEALAEAPTNPWLMNYEALSRARSGDLTSARDLSERAVNAARQTGRRDTQAQLEAARASLEAFYGDPRKARKFALDALNLSNAKTTEFNVAYVLVVIGESARASRLTADLAKRFPADTIVQYSYVPQLQALIALNHSQPKLALDLLMATSPYDLSQPLYPIYIRGRALLAMGRAREAATEFQKILNYPGLVMNDPIYGLARLELDRSYALLGYNATKKSAL